MLVGEAQLLLDLDLHRQAVAVPAALAGDVVAPHGLEAGEEVLEHPGPHVVQARACRWPSAGPRRRPTAGRPSRRCSTISARSSSRQRASTRCSRATRSSWGSTGPKAMAPDWPVRRRAPNRFRGSAEAPGDGAAQRRTIRTPMNVDDLFTTKGDDAVVLHVHVQPGAGRSAVVGRHGTAAQGAGGGPAGRRPGQRRLRRAAGREVRPEDAPRWSWSGGDTSRSKTFTLSGLDVDEFRRHLEQVVGAGRRPRQARRPGPSGLGNRPVRAPVVFPPLVHSASAILPNACEVGSQRTHAENRTEDHPRRRRRQPTSPTPGPPTSSSPSSASCC